MFRILIVLLLLVTVVHSAEQQKRIISLAPSITEIMCALDQQKLIVGVTDFCKDPYKKTDFSRMSIGGIINPNIEKMLKLRPDVVILLKGKSEHAAKLQKYGLKVIELDHMNLDGVFKSIKKLGEVCGVKERADELYSTLSKHLGKKDFSKGPRVLLTITRLSSQSNIRLWVAGNDGFYSRLLNLCGAQNAYQEDAKFQQVTLEALIKMDPDVIILLRDKMKPEEQELEIKFWKKLPTLKAVKNNNFHIITGDEIMIPGPRFPLILEKFQKALQKDE